MKVFFVGLWLTLVALGAAYGAALMGSGASHQEAREESTTLRHEKTRTMNVPIIVNGAMQGYVGMQFSFVVDTTVMKSMAVPAEVYLLDTAFSAVYMDKTIDFNHLERMDLPAFTKRLVDETNAHLGAPMIKDVLIEAFNYTPKDVGN